MAFVEPLVPVPVPLLCCLPRDFVWLDVPVLLLLVFPVEFD